MTENVDQAAPTPTESKEQLEQALFEIRRIIAGQDAMLERVLVCLLAQGHLLIEGVPGLAKTLTIKTTAGVVTSAAIVMVFVFGIFATLSIVMLKQFGVGLAAAVLIDATIVRAVLLPAAMTLLGDWNWYLPRWLEWLPKLEHERSEEVAPEPELEPARLAA